MKQDLNLYRHLDQKQSLPFSALHAVFAGAACLVLLAFVSLFFGLQNHSYSKSIATFEKEKKQLTEMNANLKATSSNSQDIALVILREKVKAKQQVLNILEINKKEEHVTFSNRLAGLGRQNIEGLWLQEIDFKNGGEQLALKGKTRTGTLVPRYLQALSNEKVFTGLHFDVLRIDKDDPEGALNFEISVVTDAEEDNS